MIARAAAASAPAARCHSCVWRPERGRHRRAGTRAASGRGAVRGSRQAEIWRHQRQAPCAANATLPQKDFEKPSAPPRLGVDCRKPPPAACGLTPLPGRRRPPLGGRAAPSSRRCAAMLPTGERSWSVPSERGRRPVEGRSRIDFANGEPTIVRRTTLVGAASRRSGAVVQGLVARGFASHGGAGGRVPSPAPARLGPGEAAGRAAPGRSVPALDPRRGAPAASLTAGAAPHRRADEAQIAPGHVWREEAGRAT
jgi:hypothetical protein